MDTISINKITSSMETKVKSKAFESYTRHFHHLVYTRSSSQHKKGCILSNVENVTLG